MPGALIAAAITIVALAITAPPPPAFAQDPAEQPPFGGEPVPRLVVPDSPTAPPPGFRLSAAEATAIGDSTGEVMEERGEGELTARAATRGPGRWEVNYRDAGGDRVAIVLIDDRTGEVLEAWTGTQVDTKLARGYEDAVSGDLNEAWFWIPLCVLFVAPFLDPRRPFRLLHLDLLALLGFSASLFFFNKGEIGVSAPLVYPVLAYLFARALLAGLRPAEHPDRLLPLLRPAWLVAGIAALVALHAGFSISQDKVIDVGLAGVVGADRLVDGEDVYSEDFAAGLPSSGDVRGDVYGPANYLAYVPFEQAFPYAGVWDDVPAARAAALGFDLLTALALFALGRRLRRRSDGSVSDEGRTLGIALAFAWLAYPFTLYTLGSSFNDSLVALLVVCCLLVLSSPPARGVMAALAGLTKFGPLALAPLLAAGTGERGERHPLTVAAFAVAFAVTAAIVTVPLLPDGGLSELYDRSFGYQASRGSPFSIWGQDPSLEPLQTASKVFAVLLGLALFFVPRRRTPAQVAALAAATLIAVQVTATHWFYPYAVWFAPLLLAALFAERSLLPRPDRAAAPPQAPSGPRAGSRAA
jgi:hypothetical protein